MNLQYLIDRILAYYPKANVELIERAYHFSQRAHEGQFRESGAPYFEHPYEVALILADLELDLETIAAGLLHDVLEDTPVTREELAAAFGPSVLMLVEGVTKLEKLPVHNRFERQAENMRKMIFAMAEDVRVILIKLADRLHNMRTLRHMPPEKQMLISQETLDIFAPLAHRMGIWRIKFEMEDLAFRHLNPEEYYRLVAEIDRKRQEREADLQEAMNIIIERLAEMDMACDIQGRPKHLYSIWQKMQKQNKSLDEIYDLMAIRIIVDTVRDCYAVLGVIHALWKPIPGRFKDYIAVPKSNLYQSLHTTVVGPRGEPYEIQIRTWEMHRIAEKGVAAHWMYKEGTRKPGDEAAKIGWLREAVEWLREMKDPQEFMDTLRIDLFEDEVFVFTPKGDVKTLPSGATPIDFAFDVHTDVGLRCFGAKVNGRIVPLNYVLKNGDFVEILTNKTASPSADWLNYVKTSKARSKIRAWLREEQREENLARGRELLEKECKKQGVDPKTLLSEENLQPLARKYGVSNPEELIASVGSGRITPVQVVQKLTGQEPGERKKLPEPSKKRRRDTTRGVEVIGADNLLVRFAKCCNPVPGDEITGYITRGRGISVHRVDCPNVATLAAESGRQIEVVWNVTKDDAYPVEIEIEGIDRPNFLTSIMHTLSERKTNVDAVTARTSKDDSVIVQLTLEIHDVHHLDNVMSALRQINGVLGVHRANPT
ncbi:MAG TPA: bifunctional (p)ppGpp synthetase/guanosine-3',5'-bis(diphosphate) 3'-pyrophosphohydrolase [Limnochordia bacterium]|nr:bifunctional (p)ppGpp synthetase/guanosine-3',5'-bis(diphosphate) 3'-pyrophosphohydrolase [Limnochordia bacterium]